MRSAVAYDGRRFVSVSNSEGGDAGCATTFHYHQDGDLVWADYAGGAVRRGMLVARCAPDGTLDARYQHMTEGGELKTGICRSTPELLADGRLRLHETWRWTSGSGDSGRSVIEETGARAADPQAISPGAA
jgi:hypothetical protein